MRNSTPRLGMAVPLTAWSFPEASSFRGAFRAHYKRAHMSVESVLEALRFDPEFMKHVAAWERLPARPAHYAELETELDPRLVAALHNRGVSPLYTHQAAAVEAAPARGNGAGGAR